MGLRADHGDENRLQIFAKMCELVPADERPSFCRNPINKNGVNDLR
jgi:hypothetical protein